MSEYTYPPLGNNPSSGSEGTTPGSFANAPDVGGPLAFSSPDTPGMPPPSAKTAWNFLPAGWTRSEKTGFAPGGAQRPPLGRGNPGFDLQRDAPGGCRGPGVIHEGVRAHSRLGSPRIDGHSPAAFTAFRFRNSAGST